MEAQPDTPLEHRIFSGHEEGCTGSLHEAVMGQFRFTLAAAMRLRRVHPAAGCGILTINP